MCTGGLIFGWTPLEDEDEGPRPTMDGEARSHVETGCLNGICKELPFCMGLDDPRLCTWLNANRHAEANLGVGHCGLLGTIGLGEGEREVLTCTDAASGANLCELLGLLTTCDDDMAALVLRITCGGENGAGADVILVIPTLDPEPLHPKGNAGARDLGDE